jgi:hypothetical protein
MIYAASGRGSFALSGDYEISYEDESEQEDLRAHRLIRHNRGESVGPLGPDKLKDELIVIFGAELSAERAVKTLIVGLPNR